MESVKPPVRSEKWVPQLMTLGLNKYEACAYLALLGHPESSAVEVADRARVPRQRIYDVLAKLSERGLIIAKQGRPMRYTALEQKAALKTLVDTRMLQQEAENNRLARLVESMISDMETTVTEGSGHGRNGAVGGF